MSREKPGWDERSEPRAEGARHCVLGTEANQSILARRDPITLGSYRTCPGA
jgi:hypothetical protein